MCPGRGVKLPWTREGGCVLDWEQRESCYSPRRGCSKHNPPSSSSKVSSRATLPQGGSTPRAVRGVGMPMVPGVSARTWGLTPVRAEGRWRVPPLGTLATGQGLTGSASPPGREAVIRSKFLHKYFVFFIVGCQQVESDDLTRTLTVVKGSSNVS